jgi:ArsR family metal-binding transcriptional regulator
MVWSFEEANRENGGCQKEGEGTGVENPRRAEAGLDPRDSDGGRQHRVFLDRTGNMRSTRLLLAGRLSAEGTVTILRMSQTITTFPQRGEFHRAKARLDRMRLPYEVVAAEPGYVHVGTAGLVVSPETRGALMAGGIDEFVCSGWVEYHPPRIAVPTEEAPVFAEDAFGQAAIMVLAPCVADVTKIRLIAHISGDLTEVFPYLNAEMKQASYNRQAPTFTFMDGYRMVSLYPRRITVAKADELVDGWRTLEAIRRRLNETWARRAAIAPSYEMREKPPALEIFKRLPRTNCRACGEATCLAFAVKVWQGGALPKACAPVFAGEYGHLKDALLEICKGLGVGE